MKVIALKKFGKFPQGEEFEFPDRAAKVMIKAKILKASPDKGLGYETRMMTASETRNLSDMPAAPYGLKADGTPRQRPGRPKAAQ